MFVWKRGLAALALVACVGLVACAELPPLEPQTCGNGVIDDRLEDCDTVSSVPLPDDGSLPTVCARPGEPNQCRQIWEEGVSVCPPGWGAGRDNVCRYGSGTFEGSSPLNAGFAFFKVGDSNGDGNADVVGQTLSGNLEAWYGNGLGAFGSQVVLTAGGLVGVPAFGSLSDELTELGLPTAEKKIDTVLPAVLGLFAVRSTSAGLDPIAFATFEIPRELDGVGSVAGSLIGNLDLVPYVSSAFALVQLATKVTLTPLVGSGFPDGLEVPTTKTIQQLVGRPIHRDLDLPGVPGTAAADVAAREEIVLGFAGDDRIFAYAFDLAAGDPRVGPYTTRALPPLILPAGLVLARPSDASPDPATGTDPVHELVGSNVVFEDQGILVVDLNRDGAPDVLARAAPASGPGGVVVVTFLGAGNGTFAPGAVEPGFNGLATQHPSCPFARTQTYSRWPIAAGDLDGDGIPEFVGGGGIYAISPVGLCAITPDDVRWSEAAIGDFNRDGRMDVAAITRFTREVEFRIGTPLGLFNRFRVSTANLPTRLRVGDFDGDLFDDLAIIEHAFDLEGGDANPFAASLSILFGDPAGAPAAAVGMGALDTVVSFDVGSSPFDPNIDAISDLMVQTTSQSDVLVARSSGVAVMVGTSQRRMLSPLALTERGPEERRFPIAIQIGHFRGRNGDVDATPDIFALAVSQANELEAWIVEGEPQQDSFSARHPFQTFDAGLSDTSFDPTCASFASGDLGSPATAPEPVPVAEIVGIDTGCQEQDGQVRDQAPILVVFRVAEPESPGGRPPLYSNKIEIPSELRNPRTPRLADVDGDGLLDIVIVFSGLADGSDPAGRGLLLLLNEGTDVRTYRTEVVPLGLVGRPLDVALINADADPALEIAVLISKVGVSIFDRDPEGTPTLSAEPEPAVRSLAEAGTLEAADVNGDGVADLLLSDFFQTHVSLAVPSDETPRDEPVAPTGAP